MIEKVLYKDKKDCTGCSACLNICPKQAISMEEDEYGFVYPKIDGSKCIKCGLCRKVCAYQNIKLENAPICAYAAMSKEDDLLMKSSSGGIFAGIAMSILKNGGIVYGCSMELINDIETPIHIRIDRPEELEKLQGSKYVKSIIGTIYQDVKKDLQDGHIVLFSGTPCQVDALGTYLSTLNVECKNLYTIDIICHGTPSTRMFQDYIRYKEKKSGKKIVGFNFRDKKINGYALQGSYIYQEKNNINKTKILYSNLSSYYELFLKSKIYRENCYSCKYACRNRVGDITIGDFWGIEEKHPEYLKQNGGELDLQKGISCIVVNTNNGEQLLEKHGDKIFVKQSTFDDVSEVNQQLKHPSNMSDDRANILEAYKENGYEGIEKLYKKSKGIKGRIRPVYYKFKQIFLKG